MAPRDGGCLLAFERLGKVGAILAAVPGRGGRSRTSFPSNVTYPMKKFSAGSCRTGMFLALFSTLLLVSTDQSQADDALDWSHWRGPEMNGISREKGIVDTWNPAGKGQNVLWKLSLIHI